MCRPGIRQWLSPKRTPSFQRPRSGAAPVLYSSIATFSDPDGNRGPFSRRSPRGIAGRGGMPNDTSISPRSARALAPRALRRAEAALTEKHDKRTRQRGCETWPGRVLQYSSRSRPASPPFRLSSGYHGHRYRWAGLCFGGGALRPGAAGRRVRCARRTSSSRAGFRWRVSRASGPESWAPGA